VSVLTLPRNPSADTVKAFEAELAKLPQASIPVKTFAGHGMVTRVILIPAGTALTGKKHRKGQHNLLVSGTIAVSTEEGVRELTGPEVIVSPPGTKRVAIALTDVIWSTTVICDETEIDAIEADIVDAADELPIVHWGDAPCLG
jgi:hypothetical protein